MDWPNIHSGYDFLCGIRRAFGRDWLWPLSDKYAWPALLADWNGIAHLTLAECPARRVVVQAGGCCGLYPELLSQVFDRVYTFEPQALNFYCLEQNIQAENVTKFYGALGDSNEQLNIGIDHVRENNTGAWAIGLPDRAEAVGQARIDDLELEVCDALLIDAEGYEAKILLGAKETIRRCKPSLIVVETAPRELTRFLNAEGYELQARKCHDFHFTLRRGYGGGSF